ncbi:MAG TPA: FAD-dependent oxidoreductase [Candidatus Nitrosotalea sp.]|nr:FAD-dependent oxidoreductase [Candidatus Nitrosotalea sp.]
MSATSVLPQSGPVVILGAGFAGLETAIHLRRRDPTASVQLVGPDPTLLYRPWVIHLVSRQQELEEMHIPLPPLAQRHGFELIQDRAIHLDMDRQRVELASGRVLQFGQLVIAAGATADRDRVPGARSHALFPCEVEDTLKMIHALDRAPKGRVAVLVGWERIGPGIEFAAWIRRIHPEVQLDLVDVQGLVRERLGGTAMRRLTRWIAGAGARVHEDTAVHSVRPGGVEMDHLHLEADLILLCSPLRGSEIGLGGELTDDLGFVPVQSTGELSRHPGVFAHGDIASFGEGDVARTMVWARSRADALAGNVLARRQGLSPSGELAPRGPRNMLPDLGGRTLWVRDRRLIASGRWPLRLRRLADLSYLSARGAGTTLGPKPEG